MSRADLGRTVPLTAPLYQSSVYNFTDVDHLDRVMNGEEPGFLYARDGHPNAARLADQLARLEGAGWGIVTGSGMGALAAACLPFVNAGDRIVVGNRLYGRTNKLLRQEFLRFGVKSTAVDCNDLSAVDGALENGARLLLVETISNPLLRVVDIPALAERTRRTGAKLIVDNTFAVPTAYRPLDDGADLVMESLTKFISGHGDVTLGFLAGNQPELLPTITQIVSTWGLSANPFDCWMCERGLSTLELRVETAFQNAMAVARGLVGRSGIARVVYPGLPDHPDYAVAERMLRGRFGHMLAFELAGGRTAVNEFMRRAPGIPFSPSLGSAVTTLSHPDTTSHRYESPAEKRRQGITDGLIRLSVGCEPIERILAELTRGLGE